MSNWSHDARRPHVDEHPSLRRTSSASPTQAAAAAAGASSANGYFPPPGGSTGSGHHQRGSSSDTKETHISPSSPTFSSSHPHFNLSHGAYRRPSSPSMVQRSGSIIGSAVAAVRSLWPRSSQSLPTTSAFPSEKGGLRGGGGGGGAGGGGHRRLQSVQVAASYVAPEPATIRFVALCALWYGSSAMSSNTGKSILNRFRYPVTLTFVQFGFVAFYCVAFLAVRESGRIRAAGGKNGHAAHTGKPTGEKTLIWGIKRANRTALYGTTVMSVFQIAGHVFSSMAIARVPVSTVHTIKALSPLFTVLSYAILFGVRYSAPTYVSLFPLTIGVMLACSFDLRANAFGFLCALGSTLVFVSQNIFSKKLLPKESSAPAKATLHGVNETPGKLDKLHLLLYSSGTAFILMIPIWVYSDAFALVSLTANPTAAPHLAAAGQSTPLGPLLWSFFLNGTVHFGQNLLAFTILARTSPVTYSIASLIKRIAVICIAIVWFGQTVHGVQGFGIAMTFGGLWMYNRAKGDVDKGERKRTQVERVNHLLLPTTMAGVKGEAMLMEGMTPPPSGRATPIGQRLPPTAPPSNGYVAGPEMGAGYPHVPHQHHQHHHQVPHDQRSRMYMGPMGMAHANGITVGGGR